MDGALGRRLAALHSGKPILMRCTGAEESAEVSKLSEHAVGPKA